MKQQFYTCRHCGNIMAMICDAGVPVQCCGEKMHRLEPGTTEASGEKHIPVYIQEGNTVHVSVGSVEHPMTEEHHIVFVYVETENGGIRVDLTDKPEAVICTCNSNPTAVYEYCNLHGLWKTEL